MRMKTAGCAYAIIMAVSAVSGLCLPARAQQPLDTSQLPRVAGAKEVYASPQSTIFTTTEPVAATSAFVQKILDTARWREFASPFADTTTTANQSILKFKNGQQGLSVFITVAPAQNNATSVSYIALALANDLPIPKDATQILFDPAEPKLIYKTTASIRSTMDFFREALVAQYWSPWSTDEAKRVTNADKTTKKSGHAVYVHGAHRPLELVVQLEDDGQLKVTLFAFPAEDLAKMGPPRPTTQASTPEIAAAKPDKKDDSATDDVLREVQRTVAAASADLKTGAHPAKAPVETDESALQALTANSTPIPLPATATDVIYEDADGLIKFKTVSSVRQIASFYRPAMKALGWHENHSVIDNDNMKVLDFAKADDDVTITIMKMGEAVNVSAASASFIAKAPEVADAAVSAKEGQTDGEQVLEAEDKHGLPVPKSFTMSVGDAAPFRNGIDASVPARLDAVLAFYRRELGAKGWTEDTAKTSIKADRAELAYTTPEGPGVLTLSLQDDATNVHLLVRKDAEAKKSGLLAKAGQTRVLLGNVTDQDAKITIDKQTISVAAGAGKSAPDGPRLELAPGKYKYSSKVGGGPAKNSELEIGADEIWGVMIAPGGSLLLQLY